MFCSAQMAIKSENITFHTLETGQKIKITKMVVKKHRDVERRKHLAKFGECAGKPPGPEPGITEVDEVELIPTFGISSGGATLHGGMNIDIPEKNRIILTRRRSKIRFLVVSAGEIIGAQSVPNINYSFWKMKKN